MVTKKECIFCKSKNIIKYGYQNKKQRYRCKDCGRTFCSTSDGIKNNRSINRLMSLLYNLLEKDFNDKDFYNKAMYKTNMHTKKIIPKVFPVFTNEIECDNPRLLICLHDSYIDFYQIESKSFGHNKNRTRTITIKDSPYYSMHLWNK